MRTLIVTDGSCSGNPGPGGYAALIRRGDQDLYIADGAQDTTNNRMELTAVVAALSMLRPREQATVQSDSQYVCKGATEWIHKWIKHNWITSTKKRVENKDLWLTLYDLIQKHDIKFEWVRGHSTDLIHKIDEMAKAETLKIKRSQL